jgi:hypothetical protein
MSEPKDYAALLNVNKRWLPPDEDCWAILGTINQGHAHIEHRGHGNPPLLVFMDGGAMELPTVRFRETLRGMQLVSEGEAVSENQTRHRDVCGSVDEYKKLIKEDPDNPVLPRLLEDIGHMIRRLAGRRDEYRQFIADVLEACAAEVRGPERVELAYELLPELQKRIGCSVEKNEAELETIYEEAEAVRDVAQYLEYALHDSKAIAMRINELFEQIRGGRTWEKGQEE